MEITQGVHRLTRGVVNFYLVEEDGRLVVVDAGAPGDWGRLVDAVASLGRALGDLEAVLLTHAHADHVGFAERARSTARARVHIHEADVDVAKGAKPPKNDGKVSDYLLRAEFYRTVFSLARRGATKMIPIHEVSSFVDGEVIDVPGKPRAVHAPGHTPGSCALVLEGRGVLFSGDVIVTRNPLTGRTGPQIMPAAFNRDTPTALESLSRLEGLAADFLLPGHGEPWRGGVAQAVTQAKAAGRS